MADVSFNMSLTSLKHLKQLRTTVSASDLAQIDITDALKDVSEILIANDGAEAEISESLASQLNEPIREANSIGFTDNPSYAFKDIYLNEYPNRAYGTLTQRSFVTEPVAPEETKLPKSLADEAKSTLEELRQFQTNNGVGVTVLRTERDGVSLEDIESPFLSPTPAVTNAGVMEDADIDDSVPRDSTLGDFPIPPPTSFVV